MVTTGMGTSDMTAGAVLRVVAHRRAGRHPNHGLPLSHLLSAVEKVRCDESKTTAPTRPLRAGQGHHGNRDTQRAQPSAPNVMPAQRVLGGASGHPVAAAPNGGAAASLCNTADGPGGVERRCTYGAGTWPRRPAIALCSPCGTAHGGGRIRCPACHRTHAGHLDVRSSHVAGLPGARSSQRHLPRRTTRSPVAAAPTRAGGFCR